MVQELEIPQKGQAIRKRWLTPAEQVVHMSSKGIRFELMTREDAILYLEKNNNYFRLRSYRKNFAKVEEGPRKGEYANLDFMMLVDTAIVDAILRNEMLILTLDIEHFAKMSLLSKIEAAGEDGYAVVTDYIQSRNFKRPDGTVVNLTKDEISRGSSSTYVSGILDKYPNFEFPAWAFMEVITFGTFCHFYRFCGQRFKNKKMEKEFYLFIAVKEIRNACAHNNCILNNLEPDERGVSLGYAVSKALGKVSGVGKEQRQSRMKNPRLRQIATTLYLHKKFASKEVYRYRAKSLHEFLSRMLMHLDYYEATATQIASTFSFLASVINAWFPLDSVTESNEGKILENYQ